MFSSKIASESTFSDYKKSYPGLPIAKLKLMTTICEILSKSYQNHSEIPYFSYKIIYFQPVNVHKKSLNMISNC